MERTKGKVLNPTSTVVQLNAKIKQLRELKKKQGSGEAQKEKDIILEEFRKKKEQYETQKNKVESLEHMVMDMEKMNGKRSANYLFIRKTISNIIARRFALESEIFSRQYGNTISIDINHQRRELNFIFRTPGGQLGISFLFQSLNCCLDRGGPRGHGYPESLRWREVVRSDVSHCESLGEHEPSVQVETSSQPSVCLLSLAKLVSSAKGLWTSGMCSWTTSTGSRFREPCSALVSRSRIISSSSSGWFSL